MNDDLKNINKLEAEIPLYDTGGALSITCLRHISTRVFYSFTGSS